MSLDCRHAVTRRSMVPKTYVFIGFLKILKLWRRGWDSNPRYGFPYARFRGEYFQPLSHLSAVARLLILAESWCVGHAGVRGKRSNTKVAEKEKGVNGEESVF